MTVSAADLAPFWAGTSWLLLIEEREAEKCLLASQRLVEWMKVMKAEGRPYLTSQTVEGPIQKGGAG